MAVTIWHLHAHAQEHAHGDTPTLAPSRAELEALIHEASLAVDLARAAWSAAEPLQRDAAWAWLQACISHRDMLVHIAREGDDILLSASGRPGRRGPAARWTPDA